MNSKPPNSTFLDLPKELADFEQARVVVLPIPYEASTTYGKGTKHGPQAILEASAQVEFYDEELDSEPCRVGIATAPPIESLNLGPEKSVAQISEACEGLLEQNKFVVSLGGEHTISVGLVRAFKKFYPDMCVLQLDAHSDLRDTYHDSQLNHACTMARIGELCPFVGIGIRSGIVGERDRLPSASKLFYAHEMKQNSDWQAQVVQTLGDPVYITIDLDFFDPSVMPSVGTPEPGGFQWYETLDFLRTIARARKIVGFDVVELSPKPGFVAPDFFAAKLVYKLIGLILADKYKNLNEKSLDS